MPPCFSLYGWPLFLENIEQDAKIMQDGAGQYKEVPDRMKIFLFAGKKANPGSIHDPAQHQEHDGRHGQGPDQRKHRDDDAPAGGDVANHPKHFEALQIDGAEYNAQNSSAPNYAKNRPSPPAAQRDQREGRIGACNQ